MQSRELLDTIVKENKGSFCAMTLNTSILILISPGLCQTAALSVDLGSCVHVCLQWFMESQRASANLPELSFLSASSSKVYCLFTNFFYSCLWWNDFHDDCVPQGAAGELGAVTFIRYKSCHQRAFGFSVFLDIIR